MLPYHKLPAFENELPKHGDRVWYWPSETTCNVAIVAEVIWQADLPLRPRLNLSVLDPLTARPYPRLGVPAVLEDPGVGTPRTQRWSLYTQNA